MTTKKTKTVKLRAGEALILRTCAADMTGHGGFQWPRSGVVRCPDWDPTPECGSGLHGLLRGEGDASMLSSTKSAVWVVAAVAEAACVDLRGKVKFPCARVVFAGSKEDAVALVANTHPESAVVFATRTAGDHGRASAGRGGTATAGRGGTATAGYGGSASAGDYGRASAGDYGRASAGEDGTATAGDFGAATAGRGGTATAGYGGSASAGDYGRASAGHQGIIEVVWRDGRRRIAVGYVGETKDAAGNVLLPGVVYRCNDGKFEVVK